MYLDRTRQDLSQLRACLQGSTEPSEIVQLAHRMKGTAASVEVNALAEAFAQLEKQAAAGRVDVNESFCDQCDTELQRVESFVNEFNANPSPPSPFQRD